MELKEEKGVAVVTSNGGLLDGAIQAFELAVGPGMPGSGEAVIDVVLSAGEFEGTAIGSLSMAAAEGRRLTRYS